MTAQTDDGIFYSDCAKCGHPIYLRSDGVWDLEYVQWEPTEWCVIYAPDGNPDGFDTKGHEPL